MNDKDLRELVEVLYPFFLTKFQESGDFKNIVKMKNATVFSVPGGTNIDKEVKVILPYDRTSFYAINKTGQELKVDDTICLMYWIDLKNAVAMFKI